MLDFVVKLIVLVAVVICVKLLIPLLGIPEPFNTVVLIILGLVGLLYLLGWIGKGPKIDLP